MVIKKLVPMNRLRLLGLFLLVLIVSCRQTTDETAMLELSQNTLTFVGEGDSKPIEIRSSSDLWRWETGVPEWLWIERISDQKVKITVSSNMGDEPRTSEIVFINGDIRRTLVIEQLANSKKPIEYFLRVEERLNFDYVSDSTEIDINTNARYWQIAKEPDWAKLSAEGKKLSIKVEPNPDIRVRKGQIILEAEDVSASI